MNKRGQAAMEFLMTYGWAILLVILVIGALAYFGVMRSQNVLPERTVFQAPITNLDIAAISLTDHTVSIAFMNSKSVGISVPRTGKFISNECVGTPQIINVTDNTRLEIAPTTQIPTNNAFVITWSCTPVNGLTVGSKFEADVTFDYINVETSQTMKNSGSIEGKFS
jgi:hypothetical protein